jgi:hypothetical protein
MREFKFRIWNTKEKEFIKRGVVWIDPFDWSVMMWCSSWPWEDPDCIPSQRTWLQDKNWVDIYEWDIVLDTGLPNNKPYEVKYFTNLSWDWGWSIHPWFYFVHEWDRWSWPDEMIYWIKFSEDSLIVGNIYETIEKDPK